MISKESTKKINKCFCGKKPIANFKIHCDGETEYWAESYVECSCGLRGKSFDTNTNASNEVELKAIGWWNEFVEKHKK